MRGKPCPLGGRAWGHRNIPAYAGKTGHWAVSSRKNAEHPRVCGENEREFISHPHHAGTSPRMRGKLALLQKPVKHVRNIPAYAGKTSFTTWVTSYQEEHPRVCGENHIDTRLSTDRIGTSPRMRGKPTGGAKVGSEIRNIPAYAGKTCAWHTSRIVNKEHPRVCGENPGTQ